MVLLQLFSEPAGQHTQETEPPESTAAHPSLPELEVKAVTPLSNVFIASASAIEEEQLKISYP